MSPLKLSESEDFRYLDPTCLVELKHFFIKDNRKCLQEPKKALLSVHTLRQIYYDFMLLTEYTY